MRDWLTPFSAGGQGSPGARACVEAKQAPPGRSLALVRACVAKADCGGLLRIVMLLLLPAINPAISNSCMQLLLAIAPNYLRQIRLLLTPVANLKTTPTGKHPKNKQPHTKPQPPATKPDTTTTSIPKPKNLTLGLLFLSSLTLVVWWVAVGCCGSWWDVCEAVCP